MDYIWRDNSIMCICKMPRISYCIQKLNVALCKACYSIAAVHKHLAEEGVSVSLQSLQKLYKKFSEHGCVLDVP